VFQQELLKGFKEYFMKILSISNLIKLHVEQNPDNIAILGLDQKPTTYRDLFNQINQTIVFLNNLGVGQNDRVAIVLPNGPLMATSFLSIACGATCAPLNPAYTESEYEFFLDDLQAKAVLVESGSDNAVIGVARRFDIPIIFLSQSENDSAGTFSLHCAEEFSPSSSPGTARTSDIALILHTSGTTSRPKMVPLTQKNLCISAENICNTLLLTPEDRCLNFMPLFHIHGLMAATLASISAGASIACMPGFYVTKFFGWVDEFSPTWYSAVPTMHQSILNRAKDNIETIKNFSLRFIRSSSSSLAPNIMSDIEDNFGVPVIEAYGMTEASHQMACNPLPPGIHKPGSVGLPAGPQIGIMAENQPEFLPAHSVGEIVIQGDNVTLGYLNNDEANAKSYTKGWFRTGDQGYLDDDGYLFITGRIKEIINRGGEKISPREVDEVVLAHPGIEQVLTFAVPDEVLGEDVGIAIVLKDENITEREIKRFAAQKLTPHKVPNYVKILSEIPKGPTGKLQRIGLAKKLGFEEVRKDEIKTTRTFISPRNDCEKTICRVWQKILNIPEAGINNPFRSLGGDSMLATLVHLELEAIFGVHISLVDLYEAETVEEQAKLILEIREDYK